MKHFNHGVGLTMTNSEFNSFSASDRERDHRKDY